MSKLKDLQFFETENASGNKPDNLVIFLHGYGSNGQDLLSLSHEFAKILPDAHFISPNAPFDLEIPISFGYQWFSLLSTEPAIIYPKIIQANNILDKFIQSQLERFNLEYKDLIMVGFSQGSMMAMYNCLSTKQPAKGVVAYSGRLILPTDLGEKINSKPRICLIHGTLDSVVPFDNMLIAKSHLEKLHIPFESHAIEGLEHSINAKGIAIAKRFMNSL